MHLNSMVKMMLISVVVMVASCATQIEKPERFDAYKSVFVSVTTALPGAEKEAATLSNMIADRLNQKMVFQNVYANPVRDAEALRIDVIIVFVNDSTDAQRIALGQIARSDEVRVDVSLKDNITNDQLSAFHLRGVSPDRTGFETEWPWGSIDMALEKVADKLVARLAEWKKS